MSEWTGKRDELGDSWDDLLDDMTDYARKWERERGGGARGHAQHWRDERWRKFDELTKS